MAIRRMLLRPFLSSSKTEHTFLRQVEIFGKKSKSKNAQKAGDKENSTSGYVKGLKEVFDRLTNFILQRRGPSIL